jgi:epoxyqueuosine reductase QueG
MTQRAKSVALEHGADLVGALKVEDLPEHREGISRILESSKSVMVVASRHSLAAIRSSNNQVAQFDTIHSYGQAERAAHRTARFLETEGYPSVAVPAFIPIDMAVPKKGMAGEICWRRAGVRSGLGSYGENGLLVTRELGAAVRISGLLTAAREAIDGAGLLEMWQSFMTGNYYYCFHCQSQCPASALYPRG